LESFLVAVFVLATAGARLALADGLRFEVAISPTLVTSPPQSGRVLVAIGKGDGEPRRTINRTDTSVANPVHPLLGTDMDGFTADKSAVLDGTSAIFPLIKLNDLPAGDYTVQAVFHTNRDIDLADAPGNLYSKPLHVKLDSSAGTVTKLELTELIPPETTPKDTDQIKYIKFPSKLLSDFHHRPMFYRAAVILPADFDKNPDKKYPLLVTIGGFGTRYFFANPRQSDPRFVTMLVDGAGPYGDPYQVNSDNSGPYGDALTQELIPFVEGKYRCIGEPRARFTNGGSTGGWVSLALQVFYPEFFNGCWSQAPDPVDFRCYELIDIYDDDNAYVNKFGFERPAKRTIDSDCAYTVRHECDIENVLGRGGKWWTSGRDWCCWNATFGPRGDDGLPKPLWDGATGKIDRSVTDHWKKYDLRMVLEDNWKTLGPKLKGKIHVWVGESDDYFLNNAVHRLKQSLSAQTDPPFDGSIQIEMRKRHEGGGWTHQQMFNAMAERAGVK
jgi:hypothetical protein